MRERKKSGAERKHNRRIDTHREREREQERVELKERWRWRKKEQERSGRRSV